jgi:hypothetical protein
VERKNRNVLAALTQGRQVDFNRIQAEQQIFAKLASLTGGFEI